MSQWANRGQVTKALIGINVLVFLAQITSNGTVTELLALQPATVFAQPWTLLTSGFAHSTADYFHIILNMYSLWVFGEAIESYLGGKRFVVLYLLSILGGSLATVFLGDGSSVVGASGGIFGLMGAYFVIIKLLGLRTSQILVLIGINVFFSFTNPSIALWAHLGGLVTGAAVTWYYAKLKR